MHRCGPEVLVALRWHRGRTGWKPASFLDPSACMLTLKKTAAPLMEETVHTLTSCGIQAGACLSASLLHHIRFTDPETKGQRNSDIAFVCWLYGYCQT